VPAQGGHFDEGGIADLLLDRNLPAAFALPAAATAHSFHNNQPSQPPQVQGWHFDEGGITDLLLAPGRGGNPAVSGTRNLQDNLSDLKAQVGGWGWLAGWVAGWLVASGLGEVAGGRAAGQPVRPQGTGGACLLVAWFAGHLLFRGRMGPWGRKLTNWQAGAGRHP